MLGASSVLALRIWTAITSLLSPPPATALAVRYASKKTGGSSKNLSGKSSGRRLGIKKMEGHHVHAGNILGTQRHFHWHPGAHVGFGKNKCLYALEEGIVHYAKDVYMPHPRNTEAVDLITRLPKGAVLYKTFVDVVPTKPEGTFKLVAMLEVLFEVMGQRLEPR
uniref:Large ribosomal subunit protein bL27m n=2 Tax=Callithrix jacchus TaxID=9483 RepID=A0A8I3VW22_CALJA